MDKNPQHINKKARREMAIKRAKRKKLIIISVIVVLLLALATFIILSIVRGSGTETYTDGEQTVELFSNGKFSAVLAHNNKLSGQYTKTGQDGYSAITFTYNGTTATGLVMNDEFYLPEEWQDGHDSHGSILPKK